MIELGKKYTTRDGRAVRILATDVKGTLWPVVGLLAMRCGVEQVKGWTADGRYLNLQDSSSLDLVPVPTKHEAWGIIRDGMEYGFNVFLTKKDALAFCSEWVDPWHIVLVTWED